MCIAILQPKGITLKKKLLERCWKKNSDGAGFMYARKGKIIVRKELDSFHKFYQILMKHREKNNTTFVIHFRISTGGRIDLRNTHPHKVNESTYLVHNGIISQKNKLNSKFSDTVRFSKLLSDLPINFMSSDKISELVRDYIGTDKMIFLNNKGEVRIINKDLGVEEFGCWFSNRSFEPPVIYTSRWNGKSDWWNKQDEYEEDYYPTSRVRIARMNNYNYDCRQGKYVNITGEVFGKDFEVCMYCFDEITMVEANFFDGLCEYCSGNDETHIKQLKATNEINTDDETDEIIEDNGDKDTDKDTDKETEELEKMVKSVGKENIKNPKAKA